MLAKPSLPQASNTPDIIPISLEQFEDKAGTDILRKLGGLWAPQALDITAVPGLCQTPLPALEPCKSKLLLQVRIIVSEV